MRVKTQTTRKKEAPTKPLRSCRNSGMYEKGYRIIESIDGEHGFKIIPYGVAQKIKVFCLLHISDE